MNLLIIQCLQIRLPSLIQTYEGGSNSYMSDIINVASLSKFDSGSIICENNASFESAISSSALSGITISVFSQKLYTP